MADTKTVTCGTGADAEKVCTLPLKVQQVVVSKQISSKDCTRGRNWDVRKKAGRDELWVRNGCRAEFAVRYDH